MYVVRDGQSDLNRDGMLLVRMVLSLTFPKQRCL
jgi:hypothetical protein